MKKELSEIIHEDITYKKVRDAFKKIGFGLFDVNDFVTNVLIKDLKDYYTTKFDGALGSKHFISGKINHIFRAKNMNKVNPKLKSIIKKGIAAFDKALDEKLIQKDESSQYYEISKSGHSLRNMLAIKRIPLARAQDIISKLLDKIEVLNNKELPFRVDNLYLYGSVQRHESDAGDIDLAFSYSHNLKDGETIREWSNRIGQQYDVPSFQSHSLINKLTKELNISPYISLGGEAELKQLIEHDDAAASLLYQRDNITVPNIKCEKYRITIIEEEPSF